MLTFGNIVLYILHKDSFWTYKIWKTIQEIKGKVFRLKGGWGDSDLVDLFVAFEMYIIR